MTVENQLPIQHFTANGSTKVFAINFAVEGKDNIKVTANEEVVTIDAYSYDNLTNSVVFNKAPIANTEITIERVTLLDRSVNYATYNNSFRPETLNYDLDRIWHVLQEQNLVDAEILARIKDEIEWRRTHDTEWDLLAQAREKGLFNALKSYMDTIGAMSVPNLFDGITDNVVITEDGVSQRVTNRANKKELAEVQQAIKNLQTAVTAYLAEAKAYTDAEKSRAVNAEGNLNTAISTERTRATVIENSLQTQINSIGGGNKAYTTYALMVADKANIPAKSKVTVTNDPDSTKNGDYQYDGSTFTKSAYDVLDLAKDYADNGIHDVAMLWFFNPYYEKSGNSLYFKPSVFGGGTANGECFYIRNSTVPDFAVQRDDFYSQLSTIGADKFKVTSPLGVTDCIRFDTTDCLYFDHVSKIFVFGARADLKPVISGKSLMIHNNYLEIGQCIERPNILSSLNNIQFNKVVNNSNAYRYASVASSRQNTYATGANSRLTTDANGLVIYDTSARMLYVPTDTIIYIDGGIISLPASNVDIGAAIDTGESTLIRVFWDKVNAKFVAIKWSNSLTEVEQRTYILFCSIRHAATYSSATVPDLVSIQGSLTYKIDCGLQGQETSKDRCTIMTGANFYSKIENYFNYNSANHTLTIPQDTVLRYGVYNYIVATATSIDLKTITTSAIRIFWDIVEDKFIAKGWSERLSSSQRHRYVLLCSIRDRSNHWGGETKDRIVLDLTVPYTIDGKLYGLTEGEGGSSSSGIVENRLDDTVKAVAHRGYSAEAPENTLPAYILAKKKGYSYAETDINFTSDEVPVLLHDDSIDRTSTGKGNITQLTFEQARKYDFGSWKGAQYTGTKIPSYEEFLQLCHSLGMHPYIELKQAMTITPARAQKLAEMVRRAGLKGKVTYISFNYAALVAIKEYDPYARLGYLADANTTTVNQTDALKTGKNEVFLDAPYSSVNRSVMDYALDKEVPVEIWTLNTASVVQGYVNIGVSGVTTDVLNIRQILNQTVGI